MSVSPFVLGIGNDVTTIYGEGKENKHGQKNVKINQKNDNNRAIID